MPLALPPSRHLPAPSRLPPPPAASQQQQQGLAFHIGDTTLSFPLRADEARRLSAALAGVMQTFADKQQAERPKRWPALEFVFKGARRQAGRGRRDRRAQRE